MVCPMMLLARCDLCLVTVRLAAGLRAGIPELTEVLVESDENSTLGQSRCQDFFVSGIFIPIARPNDVVTSHPEHIGCTAPDACVEEELHVPLSIVSNSIRS